MKQTRFGKWIAWSAAVLGLLILGVSSFREGNADSSERRPPRPGSAAAQAGGRGANSAGTSASTVQVDWDTWRQRIGSYTAADYEMLAGAAMAIADPARRQAILSDVLFAWLSFDARSFHKYFMALEVGNEVGALKLLAESLKSAMAQLADEIPKSDTLKEIVRRMVAHLAKANPEDALAWAAAVLRGDTHDSALVQILPPLTERDPARALQVIATIAGPLRRMQARAAIGGTWAKREPAAAANWADQLSVPTERAIAMNAVLLTIAQTNPADAAHRLANTESLMLQEYVVKYHNALFALNLTAADVANDPEAYLELRNSGALPPPTSPDVELLAEAARLVASKLANTNAESGATWAESLETEYLKLTAMKGALAGWSRVDPPRAIGFFVERYPRYGEILASLFETWATSDPAAAASGISLLVDPVHRGVATETVARSWVMAAPAEAVAWFDGLPAPQRTDATRLVIATALTAVNPKQAWNRAVEIADPSMQYRALKSAFSALLTADPAAARGILASTPLPARSFERLTALLGAVE